MIVAGNFGKSLVAAAPTMTAKIELTTEQKHHIASAIDQLESHSNLSTAEEIALNVLKAILPERLPTQTQLLANYPNPFNPETWVAFRMIELGHLQAGNYMVFGKAIYWDGKIETGGLVSSGTYFYQIDAGDYRATRKIVVLK